MGVDAEAENEVEGEFVGLREVVEAVALLEGGGSGVRVDEEEGRRVVVELEVDCRDGAVVELLLPLPPFPFDSNRILPLSLQYAGGGASVPNIGANPHFLTFASMNTKPA